MYDWPEVQGQTDAFWARISPHLRELNPPTGLTRGGSLSAVWQHQDLVLGQTCGLPLVRGEAGTALPVARPTYPVEGCGPGTYSSVILARIRSGGVLDDFRGQRVAINGPDSQSGCNALRDHLRTLSSDGPFFSSAIITGSHRASATAVAEGRADLCALDAVAWRLYQDTEPVNAAKLMPIDWTRPMPSLPFITSAKNAVYLPTLRRALAEAATGAGPAIPNAILPARISDYDPIRDMDLQLGDVTLAQQSLNEPPPD